MKKVLLLCAVFVLGVAIGYAICCWRLWDWLPNSVDCWGIYHGR